MALAEKWEPDENVSIYTGAYKRDADDGSIDPGTYGDYPLPRVETFSMEDMTAGRGEEVPKGLSGAFAYMVYADPNLTGRDLSQAEKSDIIGRGSGTVDRLKEQL